MYVYHKPNYLNGFSQFYSLDIDLTYLQVLEGVCRDEYRPNDNSFEKCTFNMECFAKTNM